MPTTPGQWVYIQNFTVFMFKLFKEFLVHLLKLSFLLCAEFFSRLVRLRCIFARNLHIDKMFNNCYTIHFVVFVYHSLPFFSDSKLEKYVTILSTAVPNCNMVLKIKTIILGSFHESHVFKCILKGSTKRVGRKRL